MTILCNDDRKGRVQVNETEVLWSEETWPGKELNAQRCSADVGRQRILWDLEPTKEEKRLNNLDFMEFYDRFVYCSWRMFMISLAIAVSFVMGK